MSVTIVGATTHTPQIVTGYSDTRPTGTIIHQLLATDDVAVTRRPPGAKRGTMRALFNSLADALAFHNDLLTNPSMTLVVTTDTGLNMTFVPTGETSQEFEESNPDSWWVRFDYQETP